MTSGPCFAGRCTLKQDETGLPQPMDQRRGRDKREGEEKGIAPLAHCGGSCRSRVQLCLLTHRLFRFLIQHEAYMGSSLFCSEPRGVRRALLTRASRCTHSVRGFALYPAPGTLYRDNWKLPPALREAAWAPQQISVDACLFCSPLRSGDRINASPFCRSPRHRLPADGRSSAGS